MNGDRFLSQIDQESAKRLKAASRSIKKKRSQTLSIRKEDGTFEDLVLKKNLSNLVKEINSSNEIPPWGGLSPAILPEDSLAKSRKEHAKKQNLYKIQNELIEKDPEFFTGAILWEMMEKAEYHGEEVNEKLLNKLRSKYGGFKNGMEKKRENRNGDFGGLDWPFWWSFENSTYQDGDFLYPKKEIVLNLARLEQKQKSKKWGIFGLFKIILRIGISFRDYANRRFNNYGKGRRGKR